MRYLTLASFRTGDNLDQHFRRELKVGYQDLLVSDGFLILDEVQNIYDQDHFWTCLKSGAQRRRVLAFGAFGLSTVGDSRSPLEFQSKWYYDDIKFTNDECNELVKTFKKVVSGADEILNSEYLGDLFGYLNNHPGLVYMALHHLCIEFRRAPFNAGNAAEILILVANGTLLDQLFRKARCFALDYSKIRNLLGDNADQMMGHLLTTGSLRLVDKTFGLHRAGVCIADLGETKVYFSGEIMREYYRRLFYKAIYNVDAIAVITEWETESVRSFLVRILEKFNPTVFQTSNARGRDGRLYERIYQDEFYRCCFLLTPAHCHPDVGAIYGSRGYLDFYIDGDVSWGFELLLNSNKLNSHRQRFDPSSGRYRDIPLTDFAIVDFYETDSNVTNSNVSVDDEKYYKVVFQDNFNSVKLYNQGETYVITCGN